MEKTIVVCVTVIALAAMAGAFHACARQEAHAHALRRLYVEKCRGTPQEAERVYPSGGNSI